MNVDSFLKIEMRLILRDLLVNLIFLPGCLLTPYLSLLTKATTGGVLFKKLFLKISEYSQGNTRVGAPFLIKLQARGLRPVTLVQKDSDTGVFL